MMRPAETAQLLLTGVTRQRGYFILFLFLFTSLLLLSWGRLSSLISLKILFGVR